MSENTGRRGDARDGATREPPAFADATCDAAAGRGRSLRAGIGELEKNIAAIREELRQAPAVIWDGTSENPYFGYLALADTIIVTSDSVSMVSEACSTGKPVYVLDLEGRSGRIEAFHRTLREAGMTRPFDGKLESWTYPIADDTAAAAQAVHRKMQARRSG